MYLFQTISYIFSQLFMFSKASIPNQSSSIQFNKLISNYYSLTQAQQKDFRDKIRHAVVKQKILFEKKIKDFLVKNKNKKIAGINLIAGTTGSGKSTLFNYINGLTLIVQEEKGKEGTAILKLDGRFIERNPQRVYSHIGSGFASMTTYPIFARGDDKDYINVDLPGQFDNKDFIQSIINALLRIDVCQLASRIKLTIVINFNELSNRATAFKKTIGEIQKFIGDWNRFDQNSIFLMITQVPSQMNDPIRLMKNRLLEIAEQQAYDLKTFTPILKTIIERQAFGIMPTPSKQIKLRPIGNNKTSLQEKPELIVPVGEPYSPNKNVCSPQLINKKIASVKYMEIYEDLLCPGIKPESMKLVEDICYSLIEQLKHKHLELMIAKIKAMNMKKTMNMKETMNMKKKVQQTRQNIRLITDIASLKKYLSINKDFQQSRFKDLNYFLRLTNIKGVDQQLLEIKKDLDEFISKMINDLDQKLLQLQQQKQKRIQRERKRLQTLKQKRSELRGNEERIKDLAKQQPKSKRLKQFKQYQDKMRELEDQWFRIKDQVSDQQDDDQKQQKAKLERFQGLNVESDDESLQCDDLRRKKKKIQIQKSKWKSNLKHKYSKDPIYRLVVRRRLRKIDSKLQRMKEIFQQRKQQKLSDLSYKEECIRSAFENINEWEAQKKNTKDRDDKIYYQNLVKQKREEQKELEEEWNQLKNQISDLQDEAQKRQKEDDIQEFDEDLSQETNDYDLDREELNEKISRMRSKYSSLKIKRNRIKKDDGDERIQFLKIERVMIKIDQRIKQCAQVQKQKANAGSSEDDD